MRSIALATVALAACAGLAHADVLQVGAAKDNTLFQNAFGEISNGVGAAIFAGRNAMANDSIRRGLIAFDISSIPAGSVIESVTLNLYMTQSVSGDSNVGLHRVTADWGEGASSSGSGGAGGGSGATAETGDATWLHRFYDATLWTNAGGDFVAGASATTSVGGVGSYSWSGSGLTADVQNWLDNGGNFGWLIKGDESRSSTAKRFASHDDQNDPEWQPKLTVTYTVPAPGAFGMLALSGLAAMRRRR